MNEGEIKMKDISVFELRMVKESSIEYDHKDMKMSMPDSVFNLVQELFELGNLPEELMVMLCLDTKNQVIGAFKVSHGSINASIVHPREIFKRALLSNANSIILAHNHPSGDTTPSKEDINITNRLSEAGELLGIKLLDHMIVGHNSYLSFKEKRIL